MKYIPLDAVLAIVDQLKDEAINLDDKSRWFLSAALKKRFEALEVKEVDLEKEYKDFLKCDDGRSMFETAKHFFALGLNASNPLTWEDIETIGKLRLKVALDLRNKELESSINNPIKFTEEDFCKEVLKRFKAQKGE